MTNVLKRRHVSAPARGGPGAAAAAMAPPVAPALLLLVLVVAPGAGPQPLVEFGIVRGYTRNITLKQGALQGIVVEARSSRALPPIEQYRGIPYAAAPVGELRFMPPGSAPSWFGTRYADTFGPVCPQSFPDARAMAPARRQQFLLLKRFLLNQSEDCLYLNIYAPYQEKLTSSRKYPVMVYIHGESFEWNSGNPYDGSVLAAYGNVIVVTLNFRLGVLGFLKAGTEEHSESNFGLIDQIAALLWVKENIGAFGGDPDAVTLFGHGTGAVSINLLMLSPMVQQGGNDLFHRAILMGGSALSDWALAGNPLEVTYRVAQALNCQMHDDFAACLRRKRLDEIMAAAVLSTSSYKTKFGPVIDSLVVPNDPKKSMTVYNHLFRRFELMYGVTEMESVHLLGPVALTHGMLEKERDDELRKYLRTRCEMRPELCVARTLDEYSVGAEFGLNGDKYRGYGPDQEPDKASLARNALLDILSDARTVAPIVQMAKYHSALNQQSYFYVFAHKTESKEHIRNKSFNGEELPYVFGVPLDGPKFHFTDKYTERERLFSEIIMTYITNFALTGDPNVPRKDEFYTLNRVDWIQFGIDWPEFDLKHERYLQMAIPPRSLQHYRHKEMKFWNEIFPQIVDNRTFNPGEIKESKKTRPNTPPPWIWQPPGGKIKLPGFDKYENFHKPIENDKKVYYGQIKLSPEANDSNNLMDNSSIGKVINLPPQVHKGSSTINISMTIGFLFLLVNLLIFAVVYVKCIKNKSHQQIAKNEDRTETTEDDKPGKLDEEALVGGCNLMRIISKSTKSSGTYEAVKTHHSNTKYKLARQMSNSTIDAHTKVRDWITQEIVHKYSPRFLRRPARGASKVQKQFSVDLPNFKLNDTNNSPTRPVSPDANFKSPKPILIKAASIPTKHTRPAKVSVAVDATPAGRGPSVLQQEPAELAKSPVNRGHHVESSAMRRSSTLEDFTRLGPRPELRKSTTSINLNLQMPPIERQPTVIRIEHAHSKSEPVQELYATSASSTLRTKRLKTFDPQGDVNVTSRDELVESAPLTHEEALMTIKRRNFPKVLPDYPAKEALAHKRRSMPVASAFRTIPEGLPEGKASARCPPTPPPRGTSTLTRQGAAAAAAPQTCQSAPMLAEEPPAAPEPEVACNNLYVGPLIPKLSTSDGSKLNTQPIYESLRPAKTVDNMVRRAEPRVIIKPTTIRHAGSTDQKHKNIPRVLANDNLPTVGDDGRKPANKSLIPTPTKGAGSSPSSSDSTPSEESDTGTVVKKIN